MSDNETPPLEINASPIPDQLWAGLRQLAPAVLAFAIGRQWIDNDTAGLMTAVGLMAWPIVAGQLKTRHRAKQLAVLAAHAPDSVAVVR